MSAKNRTLVTHGCCKKNQIDEVNHFIKLYYDEIMHYIITYHNPTRKYGWYSVVIYTDSMDCRNSFDFMMKELNGV